MNVSRDELRWLPISELERIKKAIQSELDDRMCAYFQERGLQRQMPRPKVYRRAKRVH